MGNVIVGNFGKKPVPVEMPDQNDTQVIITNWRLMYTTAGTSHIIGVDENGNGRVSSDIVYIDTVKNVVTTTSGRLYFLRGTPERNSIADATWGQFKAQHGLCEAD